MPTIRFCFCVSVATTSSSSWSLTTSSAHRRRLRVMLQTLRSLLSGLSLFLSVCPRGLTFSWWGCYGLCQRHKLTELALSFLFCSCVCFCLYGPFSSVSFHKFSRQLFTFSLGLYSASLVLSTIYLFIKVSLSPDIILCG